MRILILCFMAIVSLAFSIGKEIGESQSKQEVVVSTTDIPTNNVEYFNPIAIQTLSDDMHDTEEWIPPVPAISVETKPLRSVEDKPTISTTTTTVALPDGSCSEWYPVALEAGWSIDQLQKLGRIMWKESNCIHDIANKTYSYGLTQIEWSAHKGWLESEFNITVREDLYDPYTNLLVAKWLFDYAEEAYGCGWQPWYMSGDWC